MDLVTYFCNSDGGPSRSREVPRAELARAPVYSAPSGPNTNEALAGASRDSRKRHPAHRVQFGKRETPTPSAVTHRDRPKLPLPVLAAGGILLGAAALQSVLITVPSPGSSNPHAITVDTKPPVVVPKPWDEPSKSPTVVLTPAEPADPSPTGAVPDAPQSADHAVDPGSTFAGKGGKHRRRNGDRTCQAGGRRAEGRDAAYRVKTSAEARAVADRQGRT